MDTSEPLSRDVTSLSLLNRARQNQPSAWQHLVRLYSPLIFFWCRRAGLDREDAADVLQNVLQTVVRRLADYQPERGSFRGWLWVITRSRLQDHFRQRHAQFAATGGSTAMQTLREIPEHEPQEIIDESHADGAGRILERALEMIHNDFEQQTWQMFWRAAVDGQTAREIAAELGTTIDAVYQAKARVLRRLRQEMNELLNDRPHEP